MKKIAINGFGRIGRAAFKIALEHQDELEVVAINDLFDTKLLAYMLSFDTVYGKYQKKVEAKENALVVDGKEYKVFAEREPNKLPWKELGVDVVIESTGIFRTKEQMQLHIHAGAKLVMLSAPPKGSGVSTHILGVTDLKNDTNPLKSSASCTTNSITIPVKIIHDLFTVKKALLTTIHAYTADQTLVDGPHKDFRRGRTAGQNIVPTSTGAAIATTEVIPDLKKKFDGSALRVPVAVGSISDITMLVEKKTTVQEINSAFKKAVELPQYKGLLGVSEEPIVSSDIIGSTYSGIVDLTLTKVVDGDLVKIFSWYDNEWGYANRLVEAVMAS
jgi:glyceraldehyde 3-phosphate dehydrogenase